METRVASKDGGDGEGGKSNGKGSKSNGDGDKEGNRMEESIGFLGMGRRYFQRWIFGS